LGPEGLPMVTLEAMAYAIPCVLSDLPVHCEVTDNGRAALLFRRGDADDLKQKLALLIDDKNQRDSLAEQARCMVNERYHYNSARNAYLTLFAGLGPRPRDGRSVALGDSPIRSHSDAHL
jgi:glycosyltransferase involved in cell wall biosynthesis